MYRKLILMTLVKIYICVKTTIPVSNGSDIDLSFSCFWRNMVDNITSILIYGGLQLSSTQLDLPHTKLIFIPLRAEFQCHATMETKCLTWTPSWVIFWLTAKEFSSNNTRQRLEIELRSRTSRYEIRKRNKPRGFFLISIDFNRDAITHHPCQPWYEY